MKRQRNHPTQSLEVRLQWVPEEWLGCSKFFFQYLRGPWWLWNQGVPCCQLDLFKRKRLWRSWGERGRGEFLEAVPLHWGRKCRWNRDVHVHSRHHKDYAGGNSQGQVRIHREFLSGRKVSGFPASPNWRGSLCGSKTSHEGEYYFIDLSQIANNNTVIHFHLLFRLPLFSLAESHWMRISLPSLRSFTLCSKTTESSPLTIIITMLFIVPRTLDSTGNRKCGMYSNLYEYDNFEPKIYLANISYLSHHHITMRSSLNSDHSK